MDGSPDPTVAATGPVVLDHVALAVERWSDAWPRYVQELGGTWHSGGVNVGFSPAQLRFGNGAKIEVLQPWDPERNPFLRRFLDQRGPGPHHLTFKVPDIVAALSRVRAAGYAPVGERLSDPFWKEAFLHPRQATGVVVQLAQAADGDWVSPAPEGFPTGPKPAASLHHVTHAVPDLAAATGLFHAVLGGHIVGQGSAPDGTWHYSDLQWSGPLVLRLVAPAPEADGSSPIRQWLGDSPGRIHHLAFLLSRPFPDRGPTADFLPDQAPPGVDSGLGGVVVVSPEDNLGTGLVIRTVEGD
jgi:catechol 2,3-dioxygenase-like lactoylglutathione lyase family enzyme